MDFELNVFDSNIYYIANTSCDNVEIISLTQILYHTSTMHYSDEWIMWYLYLGVIK
jgi:hypothetical protein